MLEKGSLALCNVLNAARAGELFDALEAWGIETWRLDGAQAGDAAAFFAAAGRGLPGPFRVRPVADWDAFADSLWELVALAPGEECALVWQHADVMLAANVADFVDAVIALNSLARRAANPASPGSTPKLVYLFILGDGQNFST